MTLVQMKAEDVAKNLHSTNLDERRKAARLIKNAIIGNKLKKKLYANLGVISRYESHNVHSLLAFHSYNHNSLVDILASDKDDSIIIQSAAALGSFACGMIAHL
jgi:hypothetical protein